MRQSCITFKLLIIITIASVNLIFVNSRASAQADSTHTTQGVLITIENMPDQNILSVMDSTSMDSKEISDKLGNAYMEIVDLMQKEKVDFAGYPVAICHSLDKDKYVFEAGVPIRVNNIKTSGRIKMSKVPSGKCVKAVYVGPYNNMQDAYTKVMKYITSNKMQVRDFSYEVYVSDPEDTEADKLVTWIIFPVK